MNCLEEIEKICALVADSSLEVSELRHYLREIRLLARLQAQKEISTPTTITYPPNVRQPILPTNVTLNKQAIREPFNPYDELAHTFKCRCWQCQL